MKKFKLTVFCAALFLGCLVRAEGKVSAEGKSEKSENYQDIIEKAQNLILQKDRQQAMAILVKALHRESPRSVATTELKKTLNDISAVFLNDKTQQTYEMALTLRQTDLNQAQQKISEALQFEPDNDLLLVEQVRIQIAKGDCSSAEETANKAKNQNPFSEEINLGYVQAAFCLNHFLEGQKIFDAADIKKSVLSKFWLMTLAEKEFKEKNYAHFNELMGQIKKADPKYPEMDYWIWKYEQLQKRKNVDLADKYIMACKNISAQTYRQYMPDPMICRRLAEMGSSVAE